MWYWLVTTNGCFSTVTYATIGSADDSCGGFAIVVGACSLHYNMALHWPTHRLVCKATNLVLGASWLCMRHLPLDGLHLRNNRCTCCGWLSGNRYFDEELCYECGNTAVCEQCVYEVPGCGRRCYQCPLLDVFESFGNQSLFSLLQLNDHIGDAQDAMVRNGESSLSHPKQKQAFLRWALQAWLQAVRRWRLRQEAKLEQQDALEVSATNKRRQSESGE